MFCSGHGVAKKQFVKLESRLESRIRFLISTVPASSLACCAEATLCVCVTKLHTHIKDKNKSGTQEELENLQRSSKGRILAQILDWFHFLVPAHAGLCPLHFLLLCASATRVLEPPAQHCKPATFMMPLGGSCV